jgi:hypothetical protein
MVGACSSIVGWGTMWQAGRSQVQFAMRSMGVDSASNINGTRNLSGAKGELAHKADSLTAICEPIV